jgi:hypothetical protein
MYCTCTAVPLYLQDNRDTELRYRSAGNLLCASAPLIEQVGLQCIGISPAACVVDWQAGFLGVGSLIYHTTSHTSHTYQ